MEYAATWRHNICNVLSTNPCGCGLTRVIQSELLPFPDLTALVTYANTLTSWSSGCVPPDKDFATMASHQPDLPAIVAICSQHFGLLGDRLAQRLNDACTGVVT